MFSAGFSAAQLSAAGARFEACSGDRAGGAPNDDAVRVSNSSDGTVSVIRPGGTTGAASHLPGPGGEPPLPGRLRDLDPALAGDAHLTGGCRPVNLDPHLPASWRRLHDTTTTSRGVSSRAVVLRAHPTVQLTDGPRPSTRSGPAPSSPAEPARAGPNPRSRAPVCRRPPGSGQLARRSRHDAQ